MDELVQTRQQLILPSIIIPLEQNPAAVYLASLGTEHSRYGMSWCLKVAASILSSGRCTFLELDWTRLRYQHLAALKSLNVEC